MAPDLLLHSLDLNIGKKWSRRLFPAVLRSSKQEAGFYASAAMMATCPSLQQSKQKVLSYRAPWYLCNGDLSTIIPSVWATAKAVLGTEVHYTRNLMRNRNADELFSTDWLFRLPTPCVSPTPNLKVVLLVPGIGGDSHAAYVMSTALAFQHGGWDVCVLNPRGLTQHSPLASTVAHILDPTDARTCDLHVVATELAATYPNAAALVRSI